MAVKLWKGDTGESVRDLQRQLNQSGYGLDEDGVFGNKTYDAVLDYQRKNNLAVDGVVGNETWGSLGKQQAQQAASAQQSAPAASTYTPYDPSSNQAYQEALAALKNAQGGTPQYNGTYDGQLKDLYDKIVNREKFSYDIAGDPLYQQYKDQYTLQGKMAMMDTMGQAAGLTGGYGSSYGQAVGQQQYNAYLQKLTDVIPELYKQAYAQYQDEGDALSKQYGMLGDLAGEEYSKYQDAYNRWFAERGYAQDNADEAYNRGYNQWLQELNQRNADREYEMEQRQFEESVRQYNETLAENKRQFDAQQAAAAAARAASARSSSGSGSSGSSDDDYYTKLLGAVATAKGSAEKGSAQDRSSVYKESSQAIDAALAAGKITNAQAKALRKSALPKPR